MPRSLPGYRADTAIILARMLETLEGHGGVAAIDTPFNFARSFSGRNVLLTYFPFRSTWARQEWDLRFVPLPKRVRRVCTGPS
jgi:hypothetical protein